MMSHRFQLRVIRYLAITICLAVHIFSNLHAQSGSTKPPMKSLTIGNRWVYHIYHYEFFSNMTRTYRILEEVVGDTIIENKRYARVVSNNQTLIDNNTIRYEHSNDTAVYVWDKDKGEQLYCSWNLDSLKFLQAIPWSIFTSLGYSGPAGKYGDFFTSYETIVNKTDSSLFIENATESLYFGFNQRRKIGYQRQRGLLSIAQSASYRTYRGNYNKNAELIGSIINGVSTGDTSVYPHFLLYTRDTTIIFHKSQTTATIAIPLEWEGTQSPRLLTSYSASARFLYDSTIFEEVKFIAPYVKNPLTDSIPTHLLGNVYNVVKEGSLIALSTPVRTEYGTTRGAWAILKIKAPIIDTIPVFKFHCDSIIYSTSGYGNISYGLKTRNGILKIVFPTVSINIQATLPNLQARFGDTVRIPIIMTGTKQRALADSSALLLSLSLNATMLEPIMQTPMGSVNNGIRTISFHVPVSQNSDTAKVTLLFRAVIGNDSATKLVLNAQRQKGFQYRTQFVDGSIRVWGNQAGGTQLRYFSKPSGLQILNVSPNPSIDNLQCKILLEEQHPISITLINPLGQQMLQENAILSKGIHNLLLNIQEIPQGLYLLIVADRDHTLARKIQILR